MATERSSPRRLFNGGPNPEFVASADFNNDGKPDLAIANSQSSGGLAILLNTSPAPPSNMTANSNTTPQSAATGSAFANALAVTVTDSGGHPVAGVSVNVHRSVQRGQRDFPGRRNQLHHHHQLERRRHREHVHRERHRGDLHGDCHLGGVADGGLRADQHERDNSSRILRRGRSRWAAAFIICSSRTATCLATTTIRPVPSCITTIWDIEALVPSTAGQIYFYDFASGHWWYSSRQPVSRTCTISR